MYNELVERFNRALPQQIAIHDIRTNAALQPREARLVPVRDKGRAEESSSQHVATLRLVLEASDQNHLEPVWLADIADPCASLGSGLHLVDGHHRLNAYQQAGRRMIPARVLLLDARTAVMISKLANCTGRSLALHKEQCRDAAWQYLATITHRGSLDLPAGESLRTIGGRFGISKNTVSSMLGYLANVQVADFHSLAIDPGTGWPRWRYVREANSRWHTSLASSHQELLERDAEKVARAVVKIVDSSSPEVRARALEMLANEEVFAKHQIESVDFISRLDPDPTLGIIDAPVPIGTHVVPTHLAHLDSVQLRA